jgi:rubrerythrin
MDKIKRAIDSTKNRIHYITVNAKDGTPSHCVKAERQVEIQNVILRALEKQIAKKPVVATWDYEKGYECPICGYVVKQNQKYCSTCGQKLETDID